MHQKQVYFYCLLMLAVVFAGCSSKDDQKPAQKEEAESPSPVVSEPNINIEQVPSKSSIASPNITEINKPAKASIAPPAENTKKAENQNISAAAVLAQFDMPISSETKIELLESLSEQNFEQDPCVVDVARKALEDPNVEVGRAAIALLDGYDNVEILPAVAQALKNPDEQNREDAVRLLENIDDPKIEPVLALALADGSEDVRAAAIDVVMGQNEDVQFEFAKTGIASSYEDVKDSAVSVLEGRADRQSVDVLIEGLRDQDPAFHESINDALESMIEHRFDSYDQAKDWWDANKTKYDEDLALVEGN